MRPHLRAMSAIALLAGGLALPRTAASELDAKTACRAEEIIASLAGLPPDKLDFFGEDKGQGNFSCEAYFSYKAYDEVWTRVNAMMPSLRKVEAACAAAALVKLPKIGALQLQYDITAGGAYRITGAGDLPADPARLSQKLRGQIGELLRIRELDDAALRRSFALRDCPLAKYRDIK